MSIYVTYEGYPLLLLPPDLSEASTPQSTAVDMDAFVSDGGDGRQRTRAALPNRSDRLEFLLDSRQKINDMIEFLNVVAGRAYSFRLPTWNDDLEVLGAVMLFIVIRDIGYTENLFPYPAFRKILIMDRANPFNVWGRAVGASVDNGDGTETLDAVTDFPYPGEFNNATSVNYRFMFNRVVRLDTDDVEIEYLHGSAATVSLPVLHLPEG